MSAWDPLTAQVGALEGDEAFVQECWEQARSLVDKRVGTDSVPTTILVRAYTEVGADLYWRRAARNGIVGINSMDSNPVRINRDPLMACEAILAPFLSAGFA